MKQKDHLQKELDKKKFFVVRYAIYIELLVLGIAVFLLSVLKIDHHSILKMVLAYYFK